MLWVALHCPTLPLDRIRRRLPDALAPPVAVAETQGPRRSIAMANAAARRLGVTARQPVATALALCPALLVVERDGADEIRALEEAALAALRFTPCVSRRATGLVMEISASLRLFGGRRALLEQLRAALEVLGLDVAYGMAPTCGGAWLLALASPAGQQRTARSAELHARLDELPILLVAEALPHQDTLAGIGCHTIGMLRRLPRAGVARRCGPALLDALDRAYGERADPQVWAVAPEHFAARIELVARADSTEALLFPTRRLMIQLAGWLTARHAAVQALQLILHHEAWRSALASQTTLEVRLARACRDPQHLLHLIQERLGALELAAPVEEVSLVTHDLSQAMPANQELFPTPHSEALTLGRLVEKMQARLGSRAVQRLAAQADHRPEKTWVEQDMVLTAAAGKARPTTAAPRPTWLFAEPAPLTVRAHRPCHGQPLTLLAGPERIEAGWWDDALATRDYYIAENAAGQLLWIYRERKALEQDKAWFLHGLFA